MQKDALAYIKKCDKCQKYTLIIHQPGTELHLLTSPWSFAQWGLDILGPFPSASGLRKFLLVATDYFTKWVEAVPLVNIVDSNVKTFFIEKYCYSIWHSQNVGVKQWDLIQKQENSQVLWEIGNSIEFL